MKAVSDFFDLVFTLFNRANFPLLVIADGAAFAAVCITAVLCCALSKRVRSARKKPFLHITNLFAAITLIVFLTRYSLACAAAAACSVWFTGYLVYGLITLMGRRNKGDKSALTPRVVREKVPKVPPEVFPDEPPVPAVESAHPSTGGVRLEHALSIADKLLLKNLGRGDRQELERLKTTLTVLKVKGVLSPGEGETLNESFNALLKLMARYEL